MMTPLERARSALSQKLSVAGLLNWPEGLDYEDLTALLDNAIQAAVVELMPAKMEEVHREDAGYNTCLDILKVNAELAEVRLYD